MSERSPRPKFTVLRAGGPVRTPVAAISPDSADLELMRIVAILQYLVGGITLLLAATVLPDTVATDHNDYFLLGAVAVVLAGVRFLQRGAMSLAHARFSNLAGLAFIATIVAVSRPVGATPAFYLWPVLTAAYFLRRRDLAVVFVLFMVSFAIALWGFTQHEADAQIYVPMVLVIFVVTGLVRLMRESLAASMISLERTASTDDLTGLVNRASFRIAAHRDIERSVRAGVPFALALVDLDDFKAINDRLGHAAGDLALQRFAALLRAECRGGDLPARYGGEEFVVALPSTSLADAERFAERVRTRVKTGTRDDAAPLTVSIGVTALLTHDRESVESLIDRADVALYAAKAGGRNRVVRSDAIEAATDAG